MSHTSALSKTFLQGYFIAVILFALVQSVAAQVCVEPPSDLVSWWSGNGHANDIVDGNAGKLHNGTTFATGMVSQAFSFDGIDDSVAVPKASNLNVGNQITIDFWMKADPSNPMNTCCQGLVTTDFYSIEISNGD